jgi:hypothetical protein
MGTPDERDVQIFVEAIHTGIAHFRREHGDARPTQITMHPRWELGVVAWAYRYGAIGMRPPDMRPEIFGVPIGTSMCAPARGFVLLEAGD